MKSKLIEWIVEALRTTPYEFSVGGRGGGKILGIAERIADHLIAEFEKMDTEHEAGLTIINLQLESEVRQLRNKLAKRAPQWIPVSERLPDKNEIVLFFGNTNGKVYRGRYAFTGRVGAVCFAVRGERSKETIYSGITHWMPLPEPPKGDNE